ncbi:MAG: hypothetical protein K0U61_02530 [Alphaproteobacteria bacterium]|nr:hypothetical protein [Alphaproteobacteria bacterium]
MIVLEKDGAEVQKWGQLPSKIELPDRIRVHSPQLGPLPAGHVLKEVPDPPPPDPPLVELKADLSAEVGRDAERVRLKYITAGDGMAMTYREKFEQAELVNELGETVANALSEEARTAAYPTLAASVGLEADTLWDCAQLVRTAYSQFAVLSNTIEKTRLAGKKAISNASTVQAARDAYEAITWTV